MTQVAQLDQIQSDTDEPLPSLNELLPEQFSTLTAAWLGDLDGMAERRAVRTLVVSYYGYPVMARLRTVSARTD